MCPVETDCNNMSSGFSRRSFLRFSAAASVAASIPILTEAHFAYAQRRMVAKNIPPDAVRIDANENPLGPCSGACASISSLIPEGGRYDFALTLKPLNPFSDLEGLKPEYVMPYAGTSEPLHYTVLAFTSKDKPYVTGDPGYEAGMRAADLNGAKTIKVPLTSAHAHDVKAMVAADPNAGVLYICNPNNPSGTLTSKKDIVWALDNKPKGSVLLVDEAYIHFADVPDVVDQVRAGKDLIVLRTFSKIYGMAGLRCAFALGRPDLLKKLSLYGENPMPVTGSGAANASLLDANLISARKTFMTETRKETIAWLKQNNYKVIGDPHSNCFMIDTGRSGRSVMAAMQEKKIYIGRK